MCDFGTVAHNTADDVASFFSEPFPLSRISNPLITSTLCNAHTQMGGRAIDGKTHVGWAGLNDFWYSLEGSG